MLITVFTLNMYGCTDTPELLPVEQSAIGVSAQEIELVESELNAAYSLWKLEEYDQAFIALERINHETMKTVWPGYCVQKMQRHLCNWKCILGRRFGQQSERSLLLVMRRQAL